MASTLATTVTPDTVFSFEINPGTLPQFLESRAEKSPRLKCFEGSVTLVSPGKSHEVTAERLAAFILAICQELRLKHTPLAATTWTLPFGSGDTAHEADKAYYIQSHETAKPRQAPDLAIEIVVSHSEKKALRAGAFLKIPEMWVVDLRKHRVTFHHLVARGKSKGTYRPMSQGRAFPALLASEVLERLDDPETDVGAFHENCRDWARRVLVPRQQAGNGGA